MRQIPPPGTYIGQLSGKMQVEETEKGAVLVHIPYSLMGSDPAFSDTHGYCIIKKDGTVLQDAVEKLCKIFPDIDPQNVLSVEDREPDATQFELVCIHEPWTKQDGEVVTVFKVQWLNPIGGSRRAIEPIDRKSFLAKHGSKFRALSPAKVAAKPVEAKPEPVAEKAAEPEKPKATRAKATPPAAKTPPAPPAPTRTAAGQAPTATMEEAWEALVKAKPDMSEADLGAFFYSEIEREFPGKSNSDLSIQNWGQLKVQWEAK